MQVNTVNLAFCCGKRTGYEIKWRDYNNAPADHIGITVGTKGNLVMQVLLLVQVLILKIDCWCFDRYELRDNDSVTNAIAIGTGAKANRDNSVALGGGSTTDKAGTKQTSYT